MGLRMDDLHAPTVASGPTSRPAANGADKELSLQELIAQKESLEAQLSALGSVLDSAGVTMNSSLTTFDGYPRADIDVAQVRTARARIIYLKNDYKALMEKLERVVHEHFAAGKTADGDSTLQQSSTAPAGLARDALASSSSSSSAAVEPAFAKVNTVATGSPADDAGMKVGDKVTKFGSVNWTNHERLSKVAQVVQQNENRPILVRVTREPTANTSLQHLDLQLTPRRDWGGRGLLGCHLLPV